MFEGFELDDRQFEVDEDDILNTVANLPDNSVALLPRSAFWTDTKRAMWVDPDALVCDDRMQDLYFQRPSDLTETMAKYAEDDIAEIIKVGGKYVVVDLYCDELVVPETRPCFGLPINHFIADDEEQDIFFSFVEENYEIKPKEKLEALDIIYREIITQVESMMDSYQSPPEE